MLWLYRVLNGLMVFLILGIIVFTVIHTSGYDHHDLAWAFGYLIGYSLLIMIAGMLVVAIHAVVSRSLNLAKWAFVLFTLVYVVLLVSKSVTPRLSSMDTFHVRVENRSDALVPIVNVFGRGDEIRFDSLAAESSAVAIHHGREIDYSDRNSYSNRIAVSWYDGVRWRERILVHRYWGVPDTLVAVVWSGDSIEVK